ncbi:MAG TPA: tetratricopeptide repeat protein [Gemmatimonadaceae bacterium]|nr:tetratricopeptide repeat protein [Gemmatimonadaceae bacterium]
MKSLYSALIAAATIVSAVPAFAQQTAAPVAAGGSCEIEQGKPQTIARATLSLTRANAAMKGGDPTKDLKDIVGALNAPTLKNDNPVGRAFLLASAYVLLLEQPNIQPISPRSAVGLTTDPSGTIDLFAAADSAITIVEQSSPACVAYMAPFRQQKAWLNVTNAAINALNANKLDSAEIYAKRSLTLDRKSPYPYTVLASVAKNRKNFPAMIEYSRQVITASGTDTAYAEVKERAMYELASTITDRAAAAQAAEKKTLAREAIAAWLPLTESKDDVQATVAVNNLQRAYILAGDSAQQNRIYAPIQANPGKYAEGALLQAGVIASQFKRPADAAVLFEAAATRNPYSRDALNNLAASYLQAGETDKAAPIIDKLVALDPSNPDNYLLYAFEYVGKLKKKSDAKTTKMYNDSLVFWNGKAEKMPVKVSFTEFSRNNQGTTLVGTVENRSTTAKTYNLVFEFLSPKGEVLFTETTSVGPVPAKGTKDFTVRNSKTGLAVAGYRYKPVI